MGRYWLLTMALILQRVLYNREVIWPNTPAPEPTNLVIATYNDTIATFDGKSWLLGEAIQSYCQGVIRLRELCSMERKYGLL